MAERQVARQAVVPTEQEAATAAEQEFADLVARTGGCPCDGYGPGPCPEHDRAQWVAEYIQRRPDLAYAVIAAVEDWHRDRWTGVCESPEEVVLELKQAQAAIKRVRGICEVIVENAHQFYEVWDEDPTAAQVPYGQWMVARHILRALEGGSE